MKWKLIWVILALAFLLRGIALTKFPAGFNADEASFGYDSYSIINTGKDQWGNSFPLVLKSFGDYKAPLYSYLAMPFIYLGGLNVFTVRILNVIIGTLAVFVVYLLTKKISKSEQTALIASFFLAVNPWSVMLSRGAFEANLITFLVPMGIFLFISKKFSASMLLLGLSLFTYHSAKVITPAVMAALFAVFNKDLFRLGYKKLILPAAMLILFLSLLIYSFAIGGGSRIAERSITQGALVAGFEDRMKSISEGTNPVIAKIMHNKYQVIAKRFINNYLQYFSPKFLINEGAGEGSYGMIPGIGVINLFEFIAFLGIVPLLFKKNVKKIILLLLIWLFITPIPAALASGIGYAGNRASGMLPVIQILSAFGAGAWLMYARNLKLNLRKAINLALIIFVVINVFSFSKSYFKTPPNNVLRQMGYGYLDLAKLILPLSESRNILISRSLSEQQIFIAFAFQLNPKVMQESSKNWDLVKHNVAWVDQLPEYSLGRFTIKSIDWKKDSLGGSIVVVGAEEDVPAYIPIYTLYFPDGKPNINLIDTNNKIYAKIYK